MDVGTCEAVVDQLVDELMLRLWRLALLVPSVVEDRAAVTSAVRLAAQQSVTELERSGPQGASAARCVAFTLWGDTLQGPPDSWSRTPLGTVVKERIRFNLGDCVEGEPLRIGTVSELAAPTSLPRSSGRPIPLPARQSSTPRLETLSPSLPCASVDDQTVGGNRV